MQGISVPSVRVMKAGDWRYRVVIIFRRDRSERIVWNERRRGRSIVQNDEL